MVALRKAKPEPERIVVARALRTSQASPAQWECEVGDQQILYARYRFGRLQIGIGKTLSEAAIGSLKRPIVDVQIGGESEGFLSYRELQQHTRDLIAWPAVEGQGSPGALG